MQSGDKFLENAQSLIVENASNEQFGVSELAEAMNMSRSNLLRKIQKQSSISASQLIRKVRLEIAMDMLKDTSLTVSEISYKVGFGSTSYFIKCFREYYGHPPGQVGKRESEEEEESTGVVASKKYPWIIGVAAVLIVVTASFWIFNRNSTQSTIELEKSIAVLPFKNESSDSSNLYFVNGLMESALTNLQKIEDLRVISRTSVEKYRNTDKSIPEIAEELNVSYFVEGSGQRVGDMVLLNIQLIEASTDKHIWAEQYNREIGDIFALQNEIAKKITTAIKAIVTPSELEQIEKKATENLLAYDYYLQALEPFNRRTKEGLEEALPLFNEAINHDPQFALAYANIAIAYFFLDIYQEEKNFTELINENADKALLYDPKSAESLIAKAFYYMHNSEYRLALPHLEKALEYNPNSAAVVQMLSDLYARYIPNTGKYLEYALKGISLDIAADDSSTRSYTYLHLSNALIQCGFVDESIYYINKSLEYNPENYYSPYVKAFVLYARDKDIDQTKNILLDELNKDTTRLDILQEVAKVYYFKEEYDSAFYFFEKFDRRRKKYGLNIYPHEDIKIGWVYEKMGYREQAEEYYSDYAKYCEGDESIYQSASMAVKYAQEGEYDQAIEQLNIFASQDNYQYWILLFMDMDPIMKPLQNHPEFDKIMRKIEDRFWENQAKLRKSLEEKGLL